MIPADLDRDPDERSLLGLLTWAQKEADELERLIPAAIGAQWTAAPAQRPRVDTLERAKNRRSDPTAEIALDEQRESLRLQVQRSFSVIRRAIIAVRGVRLGLERSLSAWEGDESEHELRR